MVLLNIRGLAEVVVRNNGLTIKFLVVALMNRTYIEQDILVSNSGNYQSEGSETYAYSLGV